MPKKCLAQIKKLYEAIISLNYISWRATFNMLKSWKDVGWVSTASLETPSQLPSAPTERFYAADILHIK